MKVFLVSPQRCVEIIREITHEDFDGATTIEELKNGKQKVRYNNIIRERAMVIKDEKPFVLESFFTKNTPVNYNNCSDYLLDSGAFTFMNGKNISNIDWNKYIEEYADYVKQNHVEKYFELDIDTIVGYDQVKLFTKRLTKLVGYPPIPVWHTNRGKDEFIKMTKDFPYVALGGLALKSIRHSKARDTYVKAFPWFIETAHSNGTKIHALGVTSPKILKTCSFDSVDSSSWIRGSHYGYLWQFTGEDLTQVKLPDNHWFRDSRESLIFNYIEWMKFVKYAEKKL